MIAIEKASYSVNIRHRTLILKGVSTFFYQTITYIFYDLSFLKVGSSYN